MKLEMGESLIASWLKHEYGCQIIQLNWKPSNLWDNCVPPKEIEKIFKSLKKSFNDLDLEFTSEKMKSSQLILQGEIDCLGICLGFDDECIDTNKLYAEKIYAVDVAFHENGLNYGKIEETCSRIRKKFIRTALTIFQYFGSKEAEIIFATPKALAGHTNVLKQVALDVKKVFDTCGFNYSFKLFCNEDFTNFIYNPIAEKSDKISDTSELFLRSLKLIKIVGGTYLAQKHPIIKNELVTENKLSEVTNIKIGVLACNIFHELAQSNCLERKDVGGLCDEIYSKIELGLPFPALIKVNDDENLGFIDNHRRYYSKPISFFGQNYLLTNHWIESKRNLLEQWFFNIKNKSIIHNIIES